MSLFNILKTVAEVATDAVLKGALKGGALAQKEMVKRVGDYEQKLSKYEKQGNMSAEKKQKLQDAREKLNSFKEKNAIDFTPSGEALYGGKSLDQWDRQWISIGRLESADLSPYSNCVGLYRHVVHGKTKYLGRALELYNGGIRKRLSDYRRDSDSARKHTSGRIIHENLSDITTYVLVVGDNEEAVSVTKSLEPAFISKYNPEWNDRLK